MDPQQPSKAALWHNFDWNTPQDRIEEVIRRTIARHPRLGDRLTMMAGEALATEMGAEIMDIVRAAVGAPPLLPPPSALPPKPDATSAPAEQLIPVG